MKTLLILILLIPGVVCAECSDSVPYGSTDPFYFKLYDPTGVDLYASATFASGDLNISCDGATFTPPTNGFTNEGSGYYSWVPSGTELNCKRLGLAIIDQSTKVWLDELCFIRTYGATTSAAHNTTVSALAANTITTASINDGAVTAAKFTAGAIDASAIAANAIGASEIADGAIDAGAIASDAITAAAIATDAIGAAELAADGVTEIQSGLATASSISSLNNISTAQVNAEVVDALTVDTFAELATLPSSTPTIAQMLQFVYQNNAFKKDRINNLQQMYKADGSTVLAEFAVSSDGTTTTFGAAEAP